MPAGARVQADLVLAHLVAVTDRQHHAFPGGRVEEVDAGVGGGDHEAVVVRKVAHRVQLGIEVATVHDEPRLGLRGVLPPVEADLDGEGGGLGLIIFFEKRTWH